MNIRSINILRVKALLGSTVLCSSCRVALVTFSSSEFIGLGPRTPLWIKWLYTVGYIRSLPHARPCVSCKISVLIFKILYLSLFLKRNCNYCYLLRLNTNTKTKNNMVSIDPEYFFLYDDFYAFSGCGCFNKRRASVISSSLTFWKKSLQLSLTSELFNSRLYEAASTSLLSCQRSLGHCVGCRQLRTTVFRQFPFFSSRKMYVIHRKRLCCLQRVKCAYFSMLYHQGEH